MNGATLAAGRTRHAWVATALSAAVNIGFFSPRPAPRRQSRRLVSAVSYLMLLVLMILWAHARPNPVRYDWRRIVPATAAAAVAYAGAQITAPNSLLGSCRRLGVAACIRRGCGGFGLQSDAGQLVRRAASPAPLTFEPLISVNIVYIAPVAPQSYRARHRDRGYQLGGFRKSELTLRGSHQAGLQRHCLVVRRHPS